MKNVKRICAMLGVVILVLLYLSTIVFAILGKDFMNWLMAAIVASIMIPVMIWALSFFYDRVHKKDEKEEP